jgi:hypothetical protein
MEAEIQVSGVERTETRGGNTRWVIRDGDGREYTTFRPRIGEAAEGVRGRRARIEFHEQERNGFQNVYLDKIEPAPEEPQGGGGTGSDSDPDEVAWNTAVEAAPWLVGSPEPDEAVDPEELYDKLEPFKQRVAEDLREGGGRDEE